VFNDPWEIMKLIIFGASGRTGRELAQQALAQQRIVTAFVRNPAALVIKHDNLKVVRGDITAYDEVERAIEGHDAVVSALGPHTLLTRVPALVAGVRNIVRAMEKIGVRRFVYTSALGVGDSNADQNAVFRYLIRPLLLGRDYADHEANEQAIRESNLEWVIVRPARLVDRPRSGQYQVDLHLSATFPFGKIGRADVADFMLKQLADTPFLRKTPGLLAFKSL
jgi:putative NADH-flavin reductase